MTPRNRRAIESRKRSASWAKAKAGCRSAAIPNRQPARNAVARWHRVASLLLVLGVLCLAGCASTRPRPVGERPFQFERDTFAYANELLWDYAFDDAGHWRGRAREPRPDYTHRCFVVVRSARQFFQHARFDPALPKAGPEE